MCLQVPSLGGIGRDEMDHTTPFPGGESQALGRMEVHGTTQPLPDRYTPAQCHHRAHQAFLSDKKRVLAFEVPSRSSQHLHPVPWLFRVPVSTMGAVAQKPQTSPNALTASTTVL